jgi:hypothetical protein
MKIKYLLIIPALLVLVGCAALKDKTVVTTATVLGVSVAQNQGTGMYEAKLGYCRAEFVLTDTNTTDILMEFKTSKLFSFTDNGGIYQRLAIGKTAVSAGGSTAMFLKDRSGNFNTNALPTAMMLQRLSQPDK